MLTELVGLHVVKTSLLQWRHWPAEKCNRNHKLLCVESETAAKFGLQLKSMSLPCTQISSAVMRLPGRKHCQKTRTTLTPTTTCGSAVVKRKLRKNVFCHQVMGHYHIFKSLRPWKWRQLKLQQETQAIYFKDKRKQRSNGCSSWSPIERSDALKHAFICKLHYV